VIVTLLPTDWKMLAKAAEQGARRSAGLAKKEGTSIRPRGVAILTRKGGILSAPELSAEDGGGCSAERAALYRARLAGSGQVTCILIRGGTTGKSDGGPPTAASLQVILELAPRARIFWGTNRSPSGGKMARELLPGAFERAHLSST